MELADLYRAYPLIKPIRTATVSVGKAIATLLDDRGRLWAMMTVLSSDCWFDNTETEKK
jgi:hypothetical protein